MTYIVKILNSGQFFKANSIQEVQRFEKETGLEVRAFNSYDFLCSLPRIPLYKPKKDEDYLL